MKLHTALPLAAIVIGATSVNATLVAYFPLTDGADGTIATTADDIIDDPSHGITDAAVNNPGTSTDTWVFDAFRGTIVLSTTEGRRWAAGTQDIDLNDGFTWSFWAKVASSNITDPGADSIIGTRSGSWHKMDLASTSQWNGTMSYATVADDTWHHFAYVGDTTGRKIYMDGSEIASDTSVPELTTNVNFEFGGTSQYSEDITGLMSDIAIWDERISEAQITALASGAPVIPEPSAAALLGLGGLALLHRRRR